MTDREAIALGNVLDYLYIDERRDYDGSADHIYRGVYTLSHMIGRDRRYSAPAELDAQRGYASKDSGLDGRTHS